LRSFVEKRYISEKYTSLLGNTNTEVQFDGSGSIGTPGSAVLGQICDGELGVEDGKAVMDLLTIQAKLEEQDELAERISALEEAHGVN
jgi:hypothetical protein